MAFVHHEIDIIGSVNALAVPDKVRGLVRIDVDTQDAADQILGFYKLADEQTKAVLDQLTEARRK